MLLEALFDPLVDILARRRVCVSGLGFAGFRVWGLGFVGSRASGFQAYLEVPFAGSELRMWYPVCTF